MNFVQNFIAGLNERQRKLFVAAVVFVIAALFCNLLIFPTMSRLASINEDIVKEEAAIKQDMRFLNYKDRITREGREIEPYLTKKLSTNEEMIAAFLKKLEGLAYQSKVNLIKINPAPGEQDVDYWKYQADLECSGDLASIIKFMHKINSDRELMKVDKYSLNGKKTDTDEIKAVMTVEKVIVTDKPMPPKPHDTHLPPASPATTL